MQTRTVAAGDWQPDQTFWISHLFLPLTAAVLVLWTLESTTVDLWLADRWYAFEGHQWALRDHWLTYDVIHHHGKQALGVLWLALLGVLLASYRVPRLEMWRRPLGYLLTAMVLLPSLISWSKHLSPVPCPWDLARYGGDMLYRHNLDHSFGLTDVGHCFPAGHASGGYGLLAMYFAAYPFVRRPLWFLLPGITVGLIFGLGQQARGAHFISHDLWTASLSWFGALALFLLFRPQRWGAPAPAADATPELTRAQSA